jgi:type IV pilus assembly protein PilB
MGIEPFLVTASVNLIVAQRLARRVCADCKAPFDAPEQALLEIQLQAQRDRQLPAVRGRAARPATTRATRAASRSTR